MYMTEQSASRWLFERKLDEWASAAKAKINSMVDDALERYKVEPKPKSLNEIFGDTIAHQQFGLRALTGNEIRQAQVNQLLIGAGLASPDELMNVVPGQVVRLYRAVFQSPLGNPLIGVGQV